MNQLNMRELFVQKESRERQKLKYYNQILERVHNKIRATSKMDVDNMYCYYLVPEFVLALPSYNQAELTTFIVTSLEKNGFKVMVTPPNLIFITWFHFSEEYELTRRLIEDEIRSREEERIQREKEAEAAEIDVGAVEKNKGAYIKKVTDYSPRAGLVYSSDALERLQEKMNSLKTME
jgi:hypothetical protein